MVLPETSDRMTTRGDVEKEVKRKAAEERMEREAKRFAPTKIIGPNDIAVNRGLGKVKTEEHEEEVVVKVEQQEVAIVEEELDLGVEEDVAVVEEGEGITEGNTEVTMDNPEVGTGQGAEDVQVKQETESKELDAASGLDDSGIEMSQVEAPVEEVEYIGNFPADLHRNCRKEIEDLQRENLLLKQKVEVDRLQMKQMELQIQELKRKNPTMVAGMLPPILYCRGYLNYKNLLKCRRVSKIWKHEVDAFLENPPSRRPFCKMESQAGTRRRELNNVCSNGLDLGKLVERFTFRFVSTLETFITHAENFGPNPFLGRCVTFNPKCWRARNSRDPLWAKYYELDLKTDALEFERYWECVTKLLSKFGDHLFTVHIHLNSVGLTPTQLYKILERCLPQLPNLQWLSIRGRFEVRVHWDKIFLSERIADLTTYMKRKSLPNLLKLCTLDYRFDTAFEIKSAILKVSPSVTKVISNGMSKESAECIGKLAVKEIRLLYTRPRDYMSFNCLPKDLEKLDYNFNHYSMCDEKDELGISELVSVLNRFPKLCHLELRGEPVWEPQKQIVQNLSVENLKLCHMNYPKRLQMGIFKDLFQHGGYYRKVVSHFPNLRFLIIPGISCGEDTTSTEIAYGSDIWKELRKLELVSSKPRWESQKVSCWTRDKYRDFQNCQSQTAAATENSNSMSAHV